MMKKMLALVLMLCLFALPAWADTITLNIANGPLYIEDDTHDYVLIGTADSVNKVISFGPGTFNVTLKNLTVDMMDQTDSPSDSRDYKSAAFSMPSGTTVYLTLTGENKLIGGYNYAGLEVKLGAKLVITEQSTGVLWAESRWGAAIGSSHILYSGGNPTEIQNGEIIINGGTIYASSGRSIYSAYGAGIGGARDTAGGNITINGGTVTTESDGGAGIGGGIDADGYNIRINGGTVNATSSDGAGIGGGRNGNGYNITINGGDVTATGRCGTGIGGGGIVNSSQAHGYNITISGGTVTANTSTWEDDAGNAIGSNYKNVNYTENIQITGGNIKTSCRTDVAPVGGNPTNGSKSVSRYTITLEGLEKTAEVVELIGVTGYNMDGVKTHDTNKLYLYLPLDNRPTGVVVENSKGRMTYSANGPVNASANVTFSHEHQWSNVAKSGNVITAVCSETGCAVAAKFSMDDDQSTAYNGKPQEAVVIADPAGTACPAIKYSTEGGTVPENVGEYTATLTIGEYSLSAKFSITPGSLEDAAVTLSRSSATYSGGEMEPGVTVQIGGHTIKPENYTVVYRPNPMIDAGEYTVTVQGKGNCTGEASKVFTITKAQLFIRHFDFAAPSDLVYDGQPKHAVITPKSEYEGVGEITVAYYDSSSGKSVEKPTEVGRYDVEISVAEGKNYQAVEGIFFRTWYFNIVPANPKYVIPDNLTAVYGQTIGEVTVAAENGTWTWENGDAPVGDVGRRTHKATFTPNDSRNYNTITGVDVSVTVHKAAPAVTAPTANTLTYTGSAHTLITAGSTADGEMRYSLDGENWSDALPTATDAGEYTVYYKVIGDSNHLDSEAASVTVTIAQSATSMTAKLLDNKSEYTYGETVNIAVTPAATGAAPLSLRRFTAPAKGQVALYNGSEQITEPKAAGHGESVTFTLDTVADGLTPGGHTLTARYTASGNMDAQETDITFSVAFAEDAPANDADVSGDRNEAGWHRADPTLTAPEGSKISLGCGPEATWSDSLTLPTEDGEHPYTYYVKDESGLISEKAVTVMVDKSAPVVGEIDIQVGTNGAEITAPATDEHSGILDCRLKVNSGKGELEISGKGDGRYTITGMIPGETYDFTLTVMDRVSHTTAVSFTVTAAQLPQTGDESQLGLWLMLMGMACAGMLTLRRKAHN